MELPFGSSFFCLDNTYSYIGKDNLVGGYLFLFRMDFSPFFWYYYFKIGDYMRKILICFCFILGLIMLCDDLFENSFAYTYELDNSILFYKENHNALEEDISIYLESVDDYIIPNSSFIYDESLRNNYDFLINFALDYVRYNSDAYSDNIKNYDECFYLSGDGYRQSTFSYVDVSTVYEIIDKYFGVRDFSILNDNVCLRDNYISLSDYSNNLFLSNIVDVEVFKSEDKLSVEVIYSNNDKYLYIFNIYNNVLKLGFNESNIIKVLPNNNYTIDNIKFTTIPSYNINKNFHPLDNNWVGYLIEIDNIKYYIPGDTDLTNESKNVECDILFVPIGGTYTMNYKEASILTNTIKPKIVIPIHYGSIVGNKKDADKFKELVDKDIDCRIMI